MWYSLIWMYIFLFGAEIVKVHPSIFQEVQTGAFQSRCFIDMIRSITYKITLGGSENSFWGGDRPPVAK